MTVKLRQRLTIAALAVYWPALFWLSHIAVPQAVRSADVSDKILHFTAYLLLSFLLWYSCSPAEPLRWGRVKAWLCILVLICYAFTDEYIQGMTGRSCDIRDFYADLWGIAAAFGIFSLLRFWHSLLLVTLTAIFLITNAAESNMSEKLPCFNTLFHFLAYGFLALLWGHYQRIFLKYSSNNLLRLLSTALAPSAYLVIIKLFSVIFDRGYACSDIHLALAGIGAAVMLLLVTRRY